MGWANFLAGPIAAGPIAEALSRTLFHFLWEGALIAAVLAVTIYVVRPSSASIRYGLACAAMLAMMLAFAGTLARFWPQTASVTIHSNAPRLRVPPVPFTRPELTPSGMPSRLTWIVPAWLLGAVLFSLRSLMAWIAAMRLKRRAAFPAAEIWREKLERLSGRIRLSRPVTLLESCLTDVPVVVGFLSPAILVPAALFTGLPPDQLELILIHELAHIRRCDYLVNLLQSIVEDVLFYHPAVWWVSSVIRAERENCCDDIVVAETYNARGFAAALAALEQNRWAAHEAALAVNGGHLMNRVRRLLEGRDRPRLGWPALFASLLPIAFVIVASASHAQSVAPQPLFPAVPAPPSPPVLLAQASPAPAPQPPQTAQAESPYTEWLNEEVVYITSDQERKAFRQLDTDEEREKFIKQFWERRDPTPGTPENEYREEHYRRIAYANESFSDNGVPGWKTDRGMIYIKYGPPDEREEHRSGGAYQRPIEEGGGQTTSFPFEKWRYRYLQGLGNDVNIEFVDTTMKGEYHMTMDPAEKDALLYVPGTGPTLVEQMGLASKEDRFTRTDGTRLGTGTMPLPAGCATNGMDCFQRLQQPAPNPFENVPRAAAAPPTPKPVVAPEDAVEAIVFQGARRTPQDLLRNLIRTHTGDKFDKDALDRDLVALWNTKRFSDIRWTSERGKTGWIVNFTVVETSVPARN
jgi:GWxTD domain-containing protein